MNKVVTKAHLPRKRFNGESMVTVALLRFL